MASYYTLDWSNSSKAPIILPAITKDQDATSLTLFGKGAPNYGEGQQENFIRMLENFSSNTPPPHPTSGQVWWDTTIKKLKAFTGGTWIIATGGIIAAGSAPANPDEGMLWWDTVGFKLNIWNGTAWDQIYPATAVGESVIVAGATEYNAAIAILNPIIGAPVGTTLSTGYGFAQEIFTTRTKETLTNNDWKKLELTVRKLSTHMGLPTTALGSFGFIYESGNNISQGVYGLSQNFGAMLANINAMNTGTNRYNAPFVTLQQFAPPTGASSISTPWNGSVYQEISVVFNSSAALKAYFNAGGQIRFSAGLAGGSTARDTLVRNFLSATVGTVTFKALGTTNGSVTNSTGVYNITASYSSVISIVSGTSTYAIQARTEGAGQALRFKITITDTNTSSPTVGGTLTSSCDLARASSMYIDNPVILYPSVGASAMAAIPNPMSVSISPVAVSQQITNGGTASGSATATVSGGTSPFTFQWSVGSPVVGTPSNGPTSSTYNMSVALSSGQAFHGSCSCQVTDSLGQRASVAANVDFVSVVYVPPPPTYNEIVSAPSSAYSGQAFNVTITGGAPNSAWYSRDYTNGAFTGTSATYYLNSSGSYTGSFNLPTGNHYREIFFNATGHMRTMSINVTQQPAPVYSEVVSAPSSVSVNQAFMVYITGAAPNTTWYYKIYWNGAYQATSASYPIDSTGKYAGSFSVANPGTHYHEVFFNGTGHMRTFTATAPQPAPVYNEIVSAPSSVRVNTPYTATITGGAPNTTWYYKSWLNGNPNGTSSTFTLDSNGRATFNGKESLTGNYYNEVYFNGTGHMRAVTITATS